jgi:hypothetical protein
VTFALQDAQQWGGPRGAILPHGAVLKAVFRGHYHDVLPNWRLLVKANNWLSCSSASLWPVAAPCNPITTGPASASHCFEAALPTSSLCVENVAAWLSLLPCRDKAGIASLLRNRVQLMRAPFLSLALQMSNGVGLEMGQVHLTMHVRVVLGPWALGEPVPQNFERSLAHLFGSPLLGHCPGEASKMLVLKPPETALSQSCGTPAGNCSYLCLRREVDILKSTLDGSTPSTWVSCTDTPEAAGWEDRCMGPKIWVHRVHRQVHRKSAGQSSLLVHVTAPNHSAAADGLFRCCIRVSLPQQIQPSFHQMRWRSTTLVGF